MKRVNTKKEVRSHLENRGRKGIGFVPTMGALHKGHLSLVNAASESCNTTVVSIFVNPTQFNDPEDLKNYPRTIADDLSLLSKALREDDLVFIPEVKEIYPEPDTRVFSLGNLDKVMEGLHRPGHFNGVAQVVSKLFDIVKPDMAFFGQKDFQQLAIIRELVRQSGNKIKVISCPIIREPDGLAMSSRNKLLEPGIRQRAGIIYSTISEAEMMTGKADISEIRDYVIETINKTPGFRIEYFEIADDTELKLLKDKRDIISNRKYFGCIAVRAGKIRLIDNVEFSLH